MATKPEGRGGVGLAAAAVVVAAIGGVVVGSRMRAPTAPPSPIPTRAAPVEFPGISPTMQAPPSPAEVRARQLRQAAEALGRLARPVEAEGAPVIPPRKTSTPED